MPSATRRGARKVRDDYRKDVAQFIDGVEGADVAEADQNIRNAANAHVLAGACEELAQMLEKKVASK